MSDTDKMIGLAEYLNHQADGEATVFSFELVRELLELGAVADASATKITDLRLGVFETWTPTPSGDGGNDSDWKES